MKPQTGYQAALSLVVNGVLIGNAAGHLEAVEERLKPPWRDTIRTAAGEIREALAYLDEYLAASDALAAGE